MRYSILILLLALFATLMFAGYAMKIMHWPFSREVQYLGVLGSSAFLVWIITKTIRSASGK